MCNHPTSPSAEVPTETGIARVLVTGAAGYLAGFIIAELEAEYALTLFDRVPMETTHPFIQGDIIDPGVVARACAGQDAVVHTIALVRGRGSHPVADFADIMVKGTWNVLEAGAAQSLKRLINISSVVADGFPALGSRPFLPGDGPFYSPDDLYYSVSKKLGEVLGDAYARAHGLDVIHLRPGVIAGDGANPEPSSDTTGLSQPWFMYVDPRDVAQSVSGALKTSRRSGTYCIVAGRSDSLFDWRPAAAEIGYAPQYNWPEIEEVC